MEKVLLTQLSMDELRQMVQEEVKKVFQEFLESENIKLREEIMDADSTAQFLGVSKSYLYKLTSSMEIPRLKRGKRLYFKRSELIEWLSEGKQKTMKEIEMEAANYVVLKKPWK